MTRREYSTFAGAFLLSNKVVAQTETPLLDHPIPRCGERIPAVGLGTAHVFDVNECGARPMQSCRRWSRAALAPMAAAFKVSRSPSFFRPCSPGRRTRAYARDTQQARPVAVTLTTIPAVSCLHCMVVGAFHRCLNLSLGAGWPLNWWIASGLWGRGVDSAESIGTGPTTAGGRAPCQPCTGLHVGFVPNPP